MYILNYIDRNALPQAKVQGISEDIGLAGIEYNIVLSLTFIGYILMQGQQNTKVLGASYVAMPVLISTSPEQHDIRPDQT